MRQLDLFVDQRSLFEKLCDEANLYAGFAALKKNDGSPGIDDVTIEEFKSRPSLRRILKAGAINPILKHWFCLDQ